MQSVEDNIDCVMETIAVNCNLLSLRFAAYAKSK